MLAINAPPGMAPALQPFVHYRCHCAKAPIPGVNDTQDKDEPESSMEGVVQDEESTLNRGLGLSVDTTEPPSQGLMPGELGLAMDNMTIDNRTRTTQEPGQGAMTLHRSGGGSTPTISSSGGGNQQHKKKTREEIYKAGNHGESTGTLPLSRLYFCDDCDEIRCSKCVQDEIVCYYCPNCLFDVPTASVKSEKHKCSRNCFECPICQNTLSVVSEDPDTSLYGSSSRTAMVDPKNPTAAPAPPQPPAGQFHLYCNVCCWNSQEIGMTFEKPTGLAVQLQKAEEALPDIKEFEKLKDHLDKYFRTNSTTKPSLPSSLLSSIQPSTLQSFRYVSSSMSHLKGGGGGLGGSGSGHGGGGDDDILPYEPAVVLMGDGKEELDRLANLESLHQTTTMKQRLNQLHRQAYPIEQLQPQRVHLRIKKSKRCRTCRHILTKPEQKAQATRFKIQLIALNYLPSITLSSVQQPLIVHTASTIILRFNNPLPEEVQVQIRAGDYNTTTTTDTTTGSSSPLSTRHNVDIKCSQFTISAFNEVWEYEVGTQNLIQGSSAASASSNNNEQVYDRTANNTSIAVDVTPTLPGEVKIALFVTVMFNARKSVAPESNSPLVGSHTSSAGGGQVALIGGTTTAEQQALGAATSTPAQPEYIQKVVSFWTVIGLGSALPTLVGTTAPPGSNSPGSSGTTTATGVQQQQPVTTAGSAAVPAASG